MPTIEKFVSEHRSCRTSADAHGVMSATWDTYWTCVSFSYWRAQYGDALVELTIDARSRQLIDLTIEVPDLTATSGGTVSPFPRQVSSGTPVFALEGFSQTLTAPLELEADWRCDDATFTLESGPSVAVDFRRDGPVVFGSDQDGSLRYLSVSFQSETVCSERRGS